MRNTIYIDVTSALDASNVTGIQRVVINISRVLEGLDRENIKFIKFKNKDYEETKLIFKSDRKLLIISKFKNYPIIKNIRKILGQRIKNKIVELFNLKNNLNIKFSNRKTVKMIKGDKLILLDATWNYNPWKRVRYYKEIGVNVAQVVYDLLPLEMPENFTNILVRNFELWFVMIQYYCDNYYCISSSTKENLIKKIPYKRNNIEIIKMGYDAFFKKGDNLDKIKPNEKINYLTVGTLEPRKNHIFLLKAFDEIWRNNKNLAIHWHIVGNVGWMSSSLLDILKHHPESDKRLHLHINDNSDQSLRKIYSESNCILQGSKNEGYGLPIAEAIIANKSLLVSDIPVFREFNLPNECYFDLASTKDLIKKIIQMDNAGTNYNLNKYESYSWEESGRLFYEQIKFNDNE